MVSNDSNIWVCLEIMGKNYGSSPFSRLKWPYTMLERNLPTFRPVLWLVGRWNAITAGWRGGLCGGLRGLLSTSARESGNQQGRSNSKSLKSLKSLKITISSLSKSLAFVFEEIQLTVEDKSDKKFQGIPHFKTVVLFENDGKTSQMFIAIFPIIFTWLYIGVYTIFWHNERMQTLPHAKAFALTGGCLSDRNIITTILSVEHHGASMPATWDHLGVEDNKYILLRAFLLLHTI